MHFFAVISLTVLPGAWIIYGLRLSGLPSQVNLALSIALTPAAVGLQLALLEAIGIPFAVSATVLVLLNLPGVVLLAYNYQRERLTGTMKFWLSSAPLISLLIGIPVLIWSLIPGIRTYTWSSMLQTDIIYTIVRDGFHVEEANLAGFNLAYGWVGHSFWSLIGWIGDWSPTAIYPFTNILWILITFILSYQLGKSGLGLHKTTTLLGVTLMFLGTNAVGMTLLLVTGNSQWWENYFGDIRYSPFLSKFYAFDTMLWGMALLIALALVYTAALQRRVTPLDGLTVALLSGLGLIYPILFPAGLVLVVCFLFLTLVRFPKDLPEYTRWEIVRLGFAILFSVIAVGLYVSLMTADRGGALFEISRRRDIFIKTVRFLGAIGPLIIMASLPFIGFARRRYGPVMLLALSALALSAAYIVIDLAQLEYKYVLAATICIAFLATTAVDPLFRRHTSLGWATTAIVAIGLAVINLLFVFQAGGHVPGNLSDGLILDENSFWLSLNSSQKDSAWTRAIHEYTPENTVVIAQKPGVVLSVLVGRSMYVPSDTDGGHVPGYNLNQRFYLLEQRGYPADVYDHRLGLVEALYSSGDEPKIIGALHDLKALRRPLAIQFTDQDTFSLRWMETQAIGRPLFSENQNVVWLVEDPSTLP